jgi:gamma-glutamylaminecyclotransferase
MTRARNNSKTNQPSPRQGSRKPRTTRVFVFGTLLAGEHQHHLLAGARLISEAKTVPAFQLRDNGGDPLLSSGGEQAVLGEV